MKLPRKPATMLAALAVASLVVSCSSAADVTARSSLSPDEQAIQDLVRASVEAENDVDVDAFLALWTDDGLAEYDVGTRADLKAGKNPDFGSEKFQIVQFFDTDVGGDTANATVDATKIKPSFARPLFRLKFKAVRAEGEWMLNGFEFIGGPVPSEELKVLNIEGKEYAFLHTETELTGEFAMTFTNTGREQHELTLFKGPEGTELAAAGEALIEVDGQELDPLPEGYEAEHLSFAEPGDSTDIVFAEPLVAGTYFFACYIPKGGFGEEGPLDPEGKPHIELGMISRITIT